MASVLASLVVSAGISAISKALADPEAASPFDDKPTPSVRHGSFMPLVFGRGRIAPLFAWVGDRQVVITKEKAPGGKSSVFGSGPISVSSYFERAWHALCVGPGSAVEGIFSNGELVYGTRITPTSHPSGTTISVADYGSFKPYWGEIDQPVDPLISAKVAASRFPHVMSLVWGAPGPPEFGVWGGAKGKYLGQSANWPAMEYTVEVRVKDSPLLDSPAWLDETGVDKGDDGVNPAHALWQLLTQPYPHGAGIGVEHVDVGALERLGALCAEEHVPMNLVAGGGIAISGVISAILTDLSVTLPQIGEVLSVNPIREDDPAITLPSDIVIAPLPEVTIQHEGKRADRVIFIFRDQTNNYNEQDIAVDDDGSADQYGVPKVRKIPIAIVTHPEVAAAVVDRRQQEELVSVAVVTIKASRAARVLVSGQPFVVAGVGKLRLMSTLLDDLSNEVSLEAMFDRFSPSPTAYEPPAPDINIPEYDAEEDFAFTFFEFPLSVVPELRIGVFRIRANSAISSAPVWLSATGASYQQNHMQNAAFAGGELTSEFDVGIDTIVEQGPTMDAANDDIAYVLNLTGDDENWRLGLQVCILEDEVSGEHEILFLRNVTALGGASYRLDGLIRSRYDTLRRTFPVGTKVYVFRWNDVERIEDPLVALGIDLWLKTQPGTSRRIVDVSTVTPVVKTIVGRGARPLPPDNFRANDDGSHPVDEYGAGGDVLFEWTYRVRSGSGAAAGEQRAGIAITGTPSHDGVFKVEIIDPSGPTVVRTFEIDSDVTQQSYTNAQLVSDFGGEPATFDARLTNVDGAYVSDDREISVVKV